MKKNTVLFFTSLVMLCFCITKYAVAGDTIFNNGFEDGEGDWKTNNSNSTFTITSDPFYEGIQSAQVASTSTGSLGIEHSIPGIQENTDYQINGRIKTVEPAPAKAFIRIAWYESTDASGAQIKTEDSEIISAVTDWKIISYVAKSPTTAHSAKIRLLVSSGTAYFDNITLDFNISPTPELSPTPTEIIIPTPTQTIPTSIQEYSNIYISEVMVYPDTGQTEWIELYNDNDFEVLLSDWYIDDIKNAGSSPKRFTMTIAPNGYGVLDIASAMFNNDSDTVRLLNSEETENDSISYTSSQKNYSIGRTVLTSNTICFQNISKNFTNNNCIDIVPTTFASVATTTKTPSPTLKKTPSPTPGSKKLLPTLQFKKPISFQSASINMKQSNSENILGATTEIVMKESSQQPLIHTLTILAFSYSILSIISIISKIALRKRISLQ